jgi:hypothetical protein
VTDLSEINEKEITEIIDNKTNIMVSYLCQNFGRIKGNRAIDSNKITNGNDNAIT